MKAFKAIENSVVFAVILYFLAACSGDFLKISERSNASQGSNSAVKPPVPGEIRTETKFEVGKKYGASSERVVNSAFTPIPRGGGRSTIGKPYKINGRWYKPRAQPKYDKVGIASWYGPNFHGRKTANGEIYDQTALSAAHPTLPLPSYARITNTKNGRSVIVRVNDRGPFHKKRIIDLSYRAAELLGTRATGIGEVRVQYAGPAPVHGNDEKFLLASYKGPGSVEPSKIAAREKLLQNAGLSQNQIDELLGEWSIAADPAPKPRPAPVQLALSTDQTSSLVQTSAQATRIVRNSVTSSPGFVAGASPAQEVSHQPVTPLVITPRLLWQFEPQSDGVGTSGIPQLIKANPVKAQTYWPVADRQAQFNALFRKQNDALPLAFAIERTILLSEQISLDQAFSLVEIYARYGDVNIILDPKNTKQAKQVTVRTRLPFAFKSIKKDIKTATLISID